MINKILQSESSSSRKILKGKKHYTCQLKKIKIKIILQQTSKRSKFPISLVLEASCSAYLAYRPSKATLETSCSAAFRWEKVVWEVKQILSTNTVDRNLGTCPSPSLTVWNWGNEMFFFWTNVFKLLL